MKKKKIIIPIIITLLLVITVGITYALFSYSSKIGLVNGKVCDALKTYIFTKGGLEVSFYTPFEVKGVFNKVINVEKSMLAEIKENIFE